MKNSSIIYGISANLDLVSTVANHLGIEIGKNEVKHFADGEIIVENYTTVRGKDIYIIQSTCPPVTERLFELLLFIDGLRRASARKITVIMPYYGYARQDRKANPREPISARLVADMLQMAGADHVVVTDLHTPQIQGFFTVPIDDLSATPLFGEYFSHNLKGKDIVVVSPDHGGIARARRLSTHLGPNTTLAIIDKRRPRPNQVEVMNVIGSVKGKTAILVDDILDTGHTLAEAAKALINAGAMEVYAAVSHPLLNDGACQRIEDSPLKEVIVTDSIPLEEKKKTPKIKVISIAPMIAEAIDIMENNGSMSKVYDIFKTKGEIA